MTPQPLTPVLLSSVLAGLVSILTTFFPMFNIWFAKLENEKKQLLMALATAAIAVVLYVLACTPSLGFPFVTCPTGGVWDLLAAIVLAWTANQGVDRILPKPEKVKDAAKAADDERAKRSASSG